MLLKLLLFWFIVFILGFLMIFFALGGFYGHPPLSYTLPTALYMALFLDLFPVGVYTFVSLRSAKKTASLAMLYIPLIAVVFLFVMINKQFVIPFCYRGGLDRHSDFCREITTAFGNTLDSIGGFISFVGALLGLLVIFGIANFVWKRIARKNVGDSSHGAVSTL